MAYNIVSNGLVQSAGIKFTATTDNSTDWGSVPNSTYFYDFNDQFVYYKDSSGNVISIFDNGSGGTVTSVGISMPPAFSVSNSPVTGSGTIGITANGTASQYIRGDGQLATLPTNSGGGSSVSYYLNGSINQGTFGGNTYYQMSKTAIIGGGTDFNIAVDGIVARFITDANDPDQLSIPNGAWNLRFYFSASASGGTPEFYINLYKYDGASFTLISSGSANPEVITGGTIIDQYFTSIGVPTTALAITDRLAVEVYVICDGKTITLHTEDSHLCQIVTTFATGLTALNGLTDSVQYFAVGTSGTDFGISSSGDTHTFNLPTASATNRGALSSTDWTTFNNKVSTNIYVGDGTLTGTRVVTLGSYGIRFLGSAGAGTIRFDKQDVGLGLYTSYIQSINDIGLQVINSNNSVSTSINSLQFEIIVTDGVTDTSTYTQSSNQHTLSVTNGVTIRRIDIATSGISINGEYTFPNLDGSAGQVISTNGSGTLSFVTPTSGTVTSVGLTTGTTGTDINVSNSPITSSGDITLNIPTASATNRGALSSTDWSTFNGKQDAITLTTTGTSGASTLVGSTLNIPVYSSGGGGGGFTVTTQSGASYSASTSDYVLINASTFILTLPSASANAQVGVKMINATVTSIQVKTASAGVTIDGIDRSSTGLGLYNQYDAYVFISDGTNWFIVS